MGRHIFGTPGSSMKAGGKILDGRISESDTKMFDTQNPDKPNNNLQLHVVFL